MQQEQLAQASPISIQELKELSASPGPCVSALFPLHREDTRQLRVTFKKMVQQVSEKLAQRNVDQNTLNMLVEPIRELSESIEAEAEQNGVVILRSLDTFRHYFLPQTVEECVEVGDHFYLLPLLPILYDSRPFFILALSQKHIRLLRCTNTTSEEVPLPEDVPTNIDDFMHNKKPDHVLDNSVTAGPSMGSGTRVMFGTGADKEKKDQELLHFYKEVDRAVFDILKNDPSPLVIAGVEYELPLYRSVTAIQRLVDEGVRGAPDGLKGGELHKRALEVVQPYWQKEIDDALAMYDKLGGSERTSVSLKEIVKGAYDGRVLHLFVAQGARHLGNFDEMSHRVRVHGQEQPGDEDLINAAAVQTINHAGNVYVVARNKVPHGSQMAAVMRY